MKEKILNLLNGRPAFQPLFQKLHLSLLHAMGIGTGGETEKGGEKVALRYLRRKLADTPESILFDVGANVGNYTKLLKENFPNACVYTFEPSPKTFNILSKNPVISKKFNVGFGDHTEKTLLYTNKNNSAIASMYKRNLAGKHELGETEEIEVDTIDNFCAKNEVRHIDLLKLDIEGNELKCLKGAERMLESHKIRFIQFEFGGCDIDSRTFFRDFYDLLKNRYKIYRIMQHGLYEIKKYSETDELFTTTNYLAEHK